MEPIDTYDHLCACAGIRLAYYDSNPRNSLVAVDEELAYHLNTYKGYETIIGIFIKYMCCLRHLDYSSAAFIYNGSTR